MNANHQSARGSKLPSGWRRVAIKDMAESIQYGHTASAVERKDGPRFLRITDIQDGCVNWDTVPSCNIPKEDIPKYQLSSGDLVFARTGATTGKSFLIGECPEAVFASYLIRVRVSGGVDSRYLSAFFQSPDYWQQIEDGKRGIGQPNVNGTVLGQVQFPVAPMPEQRRIVAAIEKQCTRLDVGVAAIRRVDANLKRYRAAVLQAACEGRLVSGDNGNWKTTTLEDVCSKVTDGDHQPPPKAPKGIPFLTIGNISSGRLDFSDTRFVPMEYFEKIKADRVPQINDVIYSVVGATIGIPVLVNTHQKFCFQRHIALLKPSSAVLPKFLWLVMASPDFFRQAWAKTTGTAQPTLPLKALRRLPISIPPVAEQTRIVAEMERRLSVIEELEAMVAVNLQRAIRLRQSVLHRAFSGGL